MLCIEQMMQKLQNEKSKTSTDKLKGIITKEAIKKGTMSITKTEIDLLITQLRRWQKIDENIKMERG